MILSTPFGPKFIRYYVGILVVYLFDFFIYFVCFPCHPVLCRPI
uniref:Uncharacterized protein n=1 Tax=Arundo donax TaxID=35708 RepID=A0A0A8Y2M6_ARUDO